jgi:hypothetical protein
MDTHDLELPEYRRSGEGDRGADAGDDGIVGLQLFALMAQLRPVRGGVDVDA